MEGDHPGGVAKTQAQHVKIPEATKEQGAEYHPLANQAPPVQHVHDRMVDVRCDNGTCIRF